MAKWTLESGWEVTNDDVPLTTLGDRGYLLAKGEKVSLVEHRSGHLKGHSGHWRYFREYEFAAVLTSDSILLSPRGKGEKTLSFEDALEGVGMTKQERVQIMKLIYSG